MIIQSNIKQNNQTISFGNNRLKEKLRVFKETPCVCFICGESINPNTKNPDLQLTLEHLVPTKPGSTVRNKKTGELISFTPAPECMRRGKDNWTNIAAAHKKCNRQKGSSYLYMCRIFDPEIVKNIKKYCKKMSGLISIQGVDYIEMIAKTFSQELGVKINPKKVAPNWRFKL